MKFYSITWEIIGSAMEVHRELGCGFQEVIYQRALSHELREKGIIHEREVEFPVLYRDVKVGTRRIDFIVGKTILVEIKATQKLEKVHLAQAKNYLEAVGFEAGLLLNFGAPSLQYNRLFNKRNLGSPR